MQNKNMLFPIAGPIACAVALLVSMPVQAQTPPAQSVQQDYQIAAGALGPALRSFAMRAGVALTFTADQTDGKRTDGLRGAAGVPDGFARLLEGTGLDVVRLDNGGYVLRAAPPAADATTLRAVTVSAAVSPVTEGSGSYTAAAASTATRMALSLRETPQSVSVLTRQQIEDQGLVSLDDAVMAITGLVAQKGYYAGNSGSFSARGFPITNMMLDGLPTSMGANGTFNADNADLVIYDRVEVVRGANGLTSGSGNPSATLNLVRKRPTAQRQATATASIGRWNDVQLQFDAAGALNDAKSVRGRVVVAGQDQDQFYDVAHDRTRQLYGIVEADIARGATLTLGAHYRRMNNDGGSQGLPTRDNGDQLGLPRSANLSNAYDFWDQTDKTVFAEIDQRFDNGWRARLAATRKWQDLDMAFTSLGGSESRYTHNTQVYGLNNVQSSFDAMAGGPFVLLGRKHEMTVGLSRRKAVNNNFGDWGVRATPLPFDPFNWNAYAAAQPTPNLQRWGLGSTLRETGAYGSARFSITDPLAVIVGARSSWYDYTNDRAGTGYKVTREITPYAGLVYDLNATHSLYASWTEIFQPQSGVDVRGDLLKPLTGTNYEAGVKGEYFGGLLNASAAVFDIRQENRPMTDRSGPSPCPSTGSTFCTRAAGEVESRGIEFEVSGEITPGWQASAGYTYVEAKFKRDTDATNNGKLFDPDLPRHQIKIATSYRLPGDLQRWRVGGSLYAQNSIFSSDDSNIRQGGYTYVGLHAGYQFSEQLSVRLNVNNVFDKTYYQGIGWTTGGNMYGTPRNATVTLQYKL